MFVVQYPLFSAQSCPYLSVRVLLCIFHPTFGVLVGSLHIPKYFIHKLMACLKEIQREYNSVRNTQNDVEGKVNRSVLVLRSRA